MTAAEDRDRIVEYLRRRGGWVPIGSLAAIQAAELELSTQQGQLDLRVLAREGRIERRATQDGPRPAYEYRVAGATP